MFTGIIETLGIVTGIQNDQNNIHFDIQSNFCQELKIDQSIAHDGVCLTVVALDTAKNVHRVTAIHETLIKTNLNNWQIGKKINLERCMPANGRFDGHIVQGHIDTTAICHSVEEQGGSWLFRFHYQNPAHITVEKGSITVNGVSLTVVNSEPQGFSVAIIPYTYENTGFHQLQPGDAVNLEFDIVGKYVQKLVKLNQS